MGMDPCSAYVGYRQARRRWASGDTGTIHRVDDDDTPFPRTVSYRIAFDAISGIDVIIQEVPQPIDVPTMLDMVGTCLDALMRRDTGPEAEIDPVGIAIAIAEAARTIPGATVGVASPAMPWSPMKAFHRDASGRPWSMDLSRETAMCERAAAPPALRIDYNAPGRNASIRIGRLSVLSPDARGAPLDPITVLRAIAAFDRLRSHASPSEGNADDR